MPATKPNPVARVVVPLILVVVVIGLSVMAFIPKANTPQQGKQQAAADGVGSPEATGVELPAEAAEATTDLAEPPTATPAIDEADESPADTEEEVAEERPAEPANDASQQAEVDGTTDSGDVDSGSRLGDEDADAIDDPDDAVEAGLSGLRARLFEPMQAPTLGSLDPVSGELLEVRLAAPGAGVERIASSEFDRTLESDEPYVIQERTLTSAGFPPQDIWLTPYATRAVFINGLGIDLHGTENDPVWRLAASSRTSASFVAEIVNDADVLVATITKRYELLSGTHVLRVTHDFANLTTSPMSLRWLNYGPLDMPDPLGDRYSQAGERVRLGYLTSVYGDWVKPDGKLNTATKLKGRIVDAKVKGDPNATLFWPKPDDYEDATQLVWLAQTSQYFAAAMMPDYAGPGSGQSKVLFAAASRVTADVGGGRLWMMLESGEQQAVAGTSVDLSYMIYAGPLSSEALSPASNPSFGEGGLNLKELLVYNIGGPCSFCTFQWLAKPLLWILNVFHDMTNDWALAIIMLVLCVRTILHPITRKSQIAMFRFGKQMQKVAPKQKKLQEKYKHDRKRMQEEMAKLMREEGVSPTGMLGCFPMFLQTPIWIALYAMLNFAIELRHEAAFYGLFQAVTGGAWEFMSDLSSADHFITLPFQFEVPLMGTVDSLNILPLLLGFVFYAQQRYLAPPTSATMTPEQQTQQKIIKVMMVVMFPVFIYNASSGLALYFITNSTIAIFESRWIRSHADKMDLEAPKKPSRTAEMLRKHVENQAKERGMKLQAPSKVKPAKSSLDEKSGKARYKKKK